MPRTVDYPRANFKSVQELAAAVEYLGGSCSIISCAEKMNKKVSGSFNALISATIKHGLVTLKKEVLATTDLYRSIKLAYNEDEKLEKLRKAFLLPPVYEKVYERFKGKDLPISMLDKLLIRELGVEDSYGSRISGYFVEGAKAVQILENGKLVDNLQIVNILGEDDLSNNSEENLSENNIVNQGDNVYQDGGHLALSAQPNDSFVINIIGPGINTKIVINEEDDLLILDAILNKVRKKNQRK